MTKEEKIKEAWGKLCPNSQLIICMNTGYVVTYCINGISDIVDNSIINEEDIDWIYLGEDLIKWRLKSLRGIENNNGWNNIKEKGLPECEKTVIWLRDEGEPPVISSILDEDFYGAAYFTHWTEFPLKPPIY